MACPLAYCGTGALNTACTGSRSGKYPVALLLADTYAIAVQGRVQARTTGLEYGFLARPAPDEGALRIRLLRHDASAPAPVKWWDISFAERRKGSAADLEAELLHLQ